MDKGLNKIPTTEPGKLKKKPLKPVEQVDSLPPEPTSTKPSRGSSETASPNPVSKKAMKHLKFYEWKKNKKALKSDLTEAVRMLHEKTKDVHAKLMAEQRNLAQHQNTFNAIENVVEMLEVLEVKPKTKPKPPRRSKPKQPKQPITAAPVRAEDKPSNNGSTPDHQLKHLYEKHINNIIRGEGKHTYTKWTDLRYKLGDDLEVLAQKCVDAGLGYIVEGQIHVNSKNNHQAFIRVSDEVDPMISSMSARKFAMDGDTVRAFVRTRSESIKEADVTEDRPADVEAIVECEADASDREGEVQILTRSPSIDDAPRQSRRAFVISIVNELGNRHLVGSISFKNRSMLDDRMCFKFRPHDLKVPMVYIPVELCEEFFKENKIKKGIGYLYLAKITEITENGHCIGKLQSYVGICGELADEIQAILLHNNLRDVKPFESRFEEMYTDEPLVITEKDLHGREDLRKDCIFTIDPLTARDLDDAVSCKTLPNGNYEVGVHISDVTNFLEEGTELDEIVKNRATSIYLVNEVIHMLPQSLCMKCSLLPDEDKYAFSVFFEITPDATVLSTRFTRSIIRSCTQLAYEHAQKVIDNPDELYTDDDFPIICNGFSVEDIVNRVKILNSLAVTMRKKRFDNGSLSIDKPEYYFQLDPVSGEPTSFSAKPRLTANFLIEEFMLLTNQSVAKFIHEEFPDISLLRRHEKPKNRVLRVLKTKLASIGIVLDITTSKSLHEGLQNISKASENEEAVSAGLNYMLTKSMMRAKYYCSEGVDLPEEMYHYALAIPIYTHFTSPIRRYPDIVVHRLLSAALKYTELPKCTPEELHVLSDVCNDQKFNARKAGEDSTNMYFKRYVQSKKKLFIRAVVVEIVHNYLEVLVIETGHVLRIRFQQRNVVINTSKVPTAIYVSERNSKQPPIEFRLFSPINIRLTVSESKLHANFILSKDEDHMKNNSTSAIDKSMGTVELVPQSDHLPNNSTLPDVKRIEASQPVAPVDCSKTKLSLPTSSSIAATEVAASPVDDVLKPKVKTRRRRRRRFDGRYPPKQPKSIDQI